MARFSRHRKKPVQNGVNAIFSGRVRYGPQSDNVIHKPAMIPTKHRDQGGHISLSRVLYGIILIGLGLTIITGSFFVDLRSQQSSGNAGPSPRLPIRVADRISPGFLAVTNIGEMIEESGGSYSGTVATAAGDFLIVQIAYSQGGHGNLPDLSSVNDNVSGIYSRAGSASPGVESNFWEQVWTGRAVSPTSTLITATPDWKDCLAPCVGSIIISMTVARYRDVGSIGVSTIVAPVYSATSQVAGIGVGQSGSLLVELLSHGAYNNCGSDAATPGSGQTLRNCFTGTTERTELFDHTASRAQSYNESYDWSQPEVQRGIYLELDGNLVSQNAWT